MGLFSETSLSCCSFALDVETGAQRWNWTTTGISSASAVTADDVAVYLTSNGAGSSATTLYALDGQSGQSKWTLKLPGGEVLDRPTAQDGVVYTVLGDGFVSNAVGTTQQTFHAVRASTGALLWSTNVSGSSSAPAVANGVAIVSTDVGIQAVDAETGQHLWLARGVSNSWSQPAIEDGMVFSATASAMVFALDLKTGEQVGVL